MRPWLGPYLSGFLFGTLLVAFALQLLVSSPSPTGMVTGAFPEPFRVDGRWQGVIVVGADAAASDMLAAAELAQRLQWVEVAVQGPALARNSDLSVEGEAFLFETPSDTLEGSEPLSDVLDTVTGAEFSLLAGGSLEADGSSYAYTEYFSPGAGIMTAFEPADDVPDDPEEIPELYLKLAKDVPAYTYELVFDEPLRLTSGSSDAEYALTGLERERITMMGETFYILSAEHPAADSVKLTLLGGTQVYTLREGETKTFTMGGEEYVLTAGIVDANTEKVKFLLDGAAIDSLGAGETEPLGEGVELGVVDVLVNQQGAVVEFLLDTQRWVLEDGDITSTATANRYEIDGDSIRGTDFQLTGTDAGLVAGGSVVLESLSVSWTPDKDHFLLTDERLSDLADEEVLFTANWDLLFNGFETEDSSEVISLEPNGDDEYELIFENTLGEELKIPLYYDNGGTIQYGSDDDDLVVDEGMQISRGDYFLVTSDGASGRYSAEGRTHLLEYQEYDASEGVLTLTDRGAGQDVDVAITAGSGTLRIGGTSYDVLVNDSNASDSNITVDLNNDGSIDSGDIPMLVTRTLSTIDLRGTTGVLEYTTKGLEEGVAKAYWEGYGTTTSVDSFRITIADDSGEIDVSSVERCLNANYEQMTGVVGAGTAAVIMASCYNTFSNAPYPVEEQVGDEDRYQAFLTFGHLLERVEDTRGPDTLSLAAPEEQLRFLTYLVNRKAELVPDAPETVRVEQLLPGTIITDDQATNERYQLVVGGPCVNSVAARLLPNADCGYGFKPGEALIAPIEQGGKQYLLVAGYGPKETKDALSRLTDLAFTEPFLLADGETTLTTIEAYRQGNAAVQEPTPEIPSCELPTTATGRYETISTKMAIKVTSAIETKIEAVPGGAALTIRIDEPFNARFGIDWLDQTVHFYQGSCAGVEVATLEYHWPDGSQEQTKRVDLAGPGCYCMRFTSDDMALDSAKMVIVGGEHTLEFRTE